MLSIQEIDILKQFTQEDVDYVKRMVQGQKNSDAHSKKMKAFIERVKTGNVAREDKVEFGGTYFPLLGMSVPTLQDEEARVPAESNP